MARKQQGNRQAHILAEDFAPYPVWPTTVRSVMRDGRLVGVATDGSDKVGSVWLYKAVPLSPVLDVKTVRDLEDAAAPLQAAFAELAALTPVSLKRRVASVKKYREFHMLLVNVPRYYRPPVDHPLYDQLYRDFGTMPCDRRLLLFGVRLNRSMTGGARSDSLREVFDTAVQSSVEMLVGTDGVAMADFDRDFRQIDAALTRAGLTTPTGTEVALGNSWWNHGRSADLAYIPHPDHVHFFETVTAGQAAKSWLDDNHTCAEWAEKPNPEEWSVTFTTVSDFDFEFDDALSPHAAWICSLLRLDTLAVSIRGRIEPSVITREEIRRQRHEVIRDINERANQGKLERAEQQEMVRNLDQVEDYYATSAPPASLVEVSVLAALNGQVADIDQMQQQGRFPFRLALMENRQPAGLAETMLCSPARSNPHVHDLPCQVISYSGAPSLSTVGDSDGALLGFTENDRQPVYFSPSVASRADAAPMSLVVGQTRSGKTALGQWLAYQFASIPTRRGEMTPVVFVNPKPDQDLSAAALASHGRVIDLDNLAATDGIVDPIRFGAPEVGISMASSLLSTLNPWGSEALMKEYEIDVLRALRFGVERGARGTGQALLMAQDGLPDLPEGMVDKVIRLAMNEPLAKAMIGLDPNGESLKASEGLTLIQSGSKSFDVGDPKATDMVSKLKRAFVRNMVYGSQTALAHRQGVVMFDEAWVFLEGGQAEVDRLGRTGASMEVQVMMFTQKVSDAVNVGLVNYISRMLCLAIEEPEEAVAALQLMRWEDAPAWVLGRIRAKARKGKAFNWSSLRALIEPETRRVVRGSVALYNDLGGRVVPAEIVIPKWFMDLASTNPDDIARRLAAQQARDAAA